VTFRCNFLVSKVTVISTLNHHLFSSSCTSSEAKENITETFEFPASSGLPHTSSKEEPSSLMLVGDVPFCVIGFFRDKT
jgi:hypothetical protein